MGQYYYLVSSLPMLLLDAPPPFSMPVFGEKCVDQLSPGDSQLLNALSEVPTTSDEFPEGSAADKWRQWDICLRNRIAARRAGQGVDTKSYTLAEQDWFSEIDTGVQEAFGMKNPLEREKHFDLLRWRRLDDLEAGHPFDIDKLCVYKLKLFILEKRAERRKEEGRENFAAISDRIIPPTATDNNEKENL